MGEGLSARERSEWLRERVRVGWSGSETVGVPPHRICQSLGRMQHLLVGEAHHPPTQSLKGFLPSSIPFDDFVQQVNRAVDLDDQSKPLAGEVGIVGADGVLALELVPIKFAASQTRPDALLSKPR